MNLVVIVEDHLTGTGDYAAMRVENIERAPRYQREQISVMRMRGKSKIRILSPQEFHSLRPLFPPKRNRLSAQITFIRHLKCIPSKTDFSPDDHKTVKDNIIQEGEGWLRK